MRLLALVMGFVGAALAIYLSRPFPKARFPSYPAEDVPKIPKSRYVSLTPPPDFDACRYDKPQEQHTIEHMLPSQADDPPTWTEMMKDTAGPPRR